MTKGREPERRQLQPPALGWGWAALVRGRVKDRRLCAVLCVPAVPSRYSWLVMKGVLV